ncbi:MAG: glycosyltransferase family 39 protein [Streptosporangiaceae bacterium]|nr:glycosyltransferase family 39 protein [Streptosporangiaceae bacterium]
MTVTGGVRERGEPSPADGVTANRAGGAFPFDDLAERAMRVAWLWPALVTFLFGCYELTRSELWRDELSSWSFATRPVSQLINIVHHTDATQLGYYLLLHWWIVVFGDSVVAMRLLSVLAMAGAAACVTLVGRRLADARAGLAAGLIFALVPSVSRFAQEARFYALQVLVAMLATLLLLRAIDRPSPRRWVAYGVSLVLVGYIDLVALCLITGHIAVVALWRWRERDSTASRGQLIWFAAAVVASCAACLPIALVGLGQAGTQLEWLFRPGLSLNTFGFFGRNLFYSTAAAAALIIVAVFAWAVAWRPAAVATSIALAPVATVWLISQGPHSYFFPRYLLFTVAAWSLLAGLALSRLDVRLVAAAVLVFYVLGAGDQGVIREPGAHTWAEYPDNQTTYYWDFAGAARAIAKRVHPGDGIAYPGSPIRWEMIDYGVRYYLEHDLPAGRIPREVFVARTAAAAGTLYSVDCADPAVCLAHTPRMWIVNDGYLKDPYHYLPAGEAAAMSASYRVTLIRHMPGLTVFLLVRT